MGPTGLIFDVKRFSVNDGPGIRTTVFFKGCPLSCRWCHNPESRKHCVEQIAVTDILEGTEFKRTEDIGKYYSVPEMMNEIEKDTIFHDTSGGGVTFSGGEPLMQPEFLRLLAKECHKRDIHTCLDTCGECDSDLFTDMMQYFDLVLFDLKLMDSGRHLEWTGVKNDTILGNLKIMDQTGIQYILRIPLIPGVNTDTQNISSILELAGQLRFSCREIHLLPYHTMGRRKTKRMGLEYPMEENLKIDENEIQRIKSTIIQSGYTVKIGG